MAESEAWFRRFFGEEYLLFDEHPDTSKEALFIARTLGLKPRMRALDLCCGYGRHAVPLAGRGVRVVGLDLSPVLLGEARKRQKAEEEGMRHEATGGSKKQKNPISRLMPHASRLQFIRGDIRHLPFGPGFDAVISMYHDQGLAPFKMIAFRDGVNVTLGLPYVRTSPDHGTAFDIAYQGKADPSSMKSAIDLAKKLLSA